MGDRSRFTKSERKELRRLSGLAYERELSRELNSLEEKFKQWRAGKITSFELEYLIHQFHNGIARKLWSFYTDGDNEIALRVAVNKGFILKTEISQGIIEKIREDYVINDREGHV